MIKFIHTADIHFGMENYGRLDYKTGLHSRLLDFQKAVNSIIDRAIAEQVDFFLFAGDAYKTHHPTPTHQRLLLQSFMRLYRANIPVIIVVGNHDNPLSFGKAHALELFGQLPIDGFHVLARPETVQLKTKSGPVNIVGIPWPTRNLLALNQQHVYSNAIELADYISSAVSSIIEHHAQQLDPTIPAVLAGHLTVSSGIFSGSEKKAIQGADPVLLPSQLAIAPFDYVALGHLHRYQNLNSHGYPAVVYSGSPERIDFGERKEDKGFCLVTIQEKNKTFHEFIKTPVRPFIQVDVTLDPMRNQTDQIIEALSHYQLTDAIVKIIYRLPVGIRDKVDTTVVNHACSSALHVVSVMGIRSFELKHKRAGLKVEMNLETLLESYFASKKEYTSQKDALIKLALELEAQTKEQQE